MVKGQLAGGGGILWRPLAQLVTIKQTSDDTSYRVHSDTPPNRNPKPS